MPTTPETDPRETRDDLGMMRRADLWPRWPFLYVKRPRWDCGVLVEDRDTKEALPTVYTADGEVKERYESLEKLVSDGWVID